MDYVVKNFKLNETPVRTARNFNINNIKLQNVEFPKDIQNFENVTVISDISKTVINQNTSDINLSYGINDFFTEQVKKKSNKRLKIEILENSRTEIEFEFNEENLNLLDDIEIIGNENINSTIIIKYVSNKDESAFHNGIIRIHAKQNSNINVILINLMNTKSKNFVAIQNDLENNSKVNFTIVDFGGEQSISNYFSEVNGEQAKNNLNTIYLGTKNQLFDINYIINLKGNSSEAKIEVQGALKDQAKKNFKGTIDFKKGCKKAKGEENEFCLLLSEDARSKALPMLLCTEEDVEGSHSSAAGKIESNILFYIMSRGLSYEEAMKIIVKAKFSGVLDNINDEIIKEQIIEKIDEKL